MLAGIDYVSATTDDDGVGMSWATLFLHKVEQAGEFGPVKRYDKDLYGYQGRAADTKIGWQFYGYSPARMSYFYTASGQISQEAFLAIRSVAKRVSRVDLQITVDLPEKNDYLLEAEFTRIRQEGLSRGRQYRLVASESSQGSKGQTLYVGSRKTGKMIRIYDKGAQQGLEAGLSYRWEVEYKDDYAKRLLDLGLRNVPSHRMIHFAEQTVVAECKEAGIITPYSKESIEGGKAVTQIGLKETSIDRKISWLRSQVAPSLKELLECMTHQEVAEILGLVDVTWEVKREYTHEITPDMLAVQLPFDI